MPRVIKGKDLMFNDGPQSFSKHFVEPVDGMTQTLHVHLEEYAPGGRTQKHGHVNEAAFYILDGKRLRGARRHPLRLEGRRRRHRAHELRAPALQRRPGQARARAGDEAQAACSCS